MNAANNQWLPQWNEQKIKQKKKKESYFYYDLS